LIEVKRAAAEGVNSTHREAAVRAREKARVLGAKNAGRKALPTAGKRERISF
jgi:hypothetical protein